MQSWPNSGHAGAEDPNSWQSGYPYAGQPEDQFESAQAWQQQVPGQDPYAHLTSQGGAPPNYFDPRQQTDGFGQLHGTPDSNQPGYQRGHDTISLSQQFAASAQGVVDQDYESVHPNLYGQQGGKHGLNDNNAMQGMVQVPDTASSHAQGFTHVDFPYGAQGDQVYAQNVHQYDPQSQIMQQARQQSHTPLQQPFEQMQGGFPQGQGFTRSQQQSPAQQQAQPYSQNQAFQQQANGQHAQFQQQNAGLHYQNGQQQQQHQQQAYHPQDFSNPPKTLAAYPQQPQTVATHQIPQPATQPHNLAAGRPSSAQPQSFAAAPQTQQPQHQPQPPQVPQQYQYATPEAAVLQAPPAEEPVKKRKRVAKAPPTPTPAPAVAEAASTYSHVDSPVDLSLEKSADVTGLQAPEPSAEEAALLVQASKRSKAAQNKQPSIKGFPHLLYDGNIKLPAPKSYDKLAPLVAHPARGGKGIAPEVKQSLACEIQGKFTSTYRPSPEKGGLDERRIEAKTLLDDFDRSMKALGKRRPKYTEYPHSFKEQLKSDEASKNKAEKKAKKELEEERNKPIRPAMRPVDPIAAAHWDAIGFVHIDKGIERTSSLIAGRVQQAGDLLIQLRSEMNQTKVELDQAIKDQVAEPGLTKLKAEAEQKKEAFYQALDATIEHADDAVLDNLGGHQKLILSLLNALISCIKTSDFSGKIPKAVLELFTHFRMTKKIAETTNFETVRKRFADKGDNEIKGLVTEITANVKKITKMNEPETATGYTGTSAASRAKAGTASRSASDGSSNKRSRDEETDTRTVKKIAVESSGSSLSKKLAQPKAPSQPATKIVSAKPSTSTLLPGKTRPAAKPATKIESTGRESPNNVKDEKVKMEAKKVVSKPEVPKTEVKPPAPKMGAPPSSSALSGIASLLDSINAPKAEPSAATSKERKGSGTPETSEDKAKRLRKETRRKLRVSWKPDEELVQVKVFEKDDAEDEGREVNMIRDAADDRSEGMVLKQRANVDEDEDDDDIPYQPWEGPTATDFSNLPEDVRNKNFVNRGGNVSFTTEEQRQIAAREQNELVAIYTDPSQIPPSPRSPPPDTSSAPAEPKTAQLPEKHAKFTEMNSRIRDLRLMGADGAMYAASQRLGMRNPSADKTETMVGRLGSAVQPHEIRHHASAAASVAVAHNPPLVVGPQAEDQVLVWLTFGAIKLWRDPNPVHVDLARAHHYVDPIAQAAGQAIEAVAAALAGKPYPPTSPPDWMLRDEEKVREWWFGYNKEAGARQRKAEEERARAEAEANAVRAVGGTTATGQANASDWSSYYEQQQQQQQQDYAPYMALLQQMTGGQSQSPAPAAPAANPQSSIPDNQLQSILAAINQPGGSSTQTAAATNLHPNDNSYQQLMMLTQMVQGQQGGPSTNTQPPPPPPPSGMHPDREREWASEHYQDSHKDYRDGKDSKKRKATLPPHKPINKALIGTKACTFWQQGKCARGDQCTFRHD